MATTPQGTKAPANGLVAVKSWTEYCASRRHEGNESLKRDKHHVRSHSDPAAGGATRQEEIRR